MRLGTCLYNWIWQGDVHAVVDHVADLGFGAVEIMATPPQLAAKSFGQREREALREHLDRRGITVTSLNPTFIDLNLASRYEAFRRESIDEVKACIDVAADIGAGIVVVGPGRRHPLVLEPLDLSDSLAHPAMRECIDYAGSKGVIYGFENITSLYMVRSDEIAAFVDEVDSPYCKAVFDSANALYAEDPAQAVRTLGDRICHVHLSDTDGKVPAHWPIGQGRVDFAAIRDALVEIGYDGWSMLETTWMDDPDGAVRSSVPRLEALGWEVVPPGSAR